MTTNSAPGPAARAEIRRRLVFALKRIDPKVLRETAQEWAENPRCALLLKRHFLIGCCGHWSQGLFDLLAAEMGKALQSPPQAAPKKQPSARGAGEPRLSPNQKVIMDYMKSKDGKPVYLGGALRADCFAGWELRELERALKGLVTRGLLVPTGNNIYRLPKAD